MIMDSGVLRRTLRLAAGLGCAFLSYSGALGQVVSLSQWKLQDAKLVVGAGHDISRVGFRPERWYKATIPATVLATLVENKVYPEPLYGENNRTIPESLCRTRYWYRTEFQVPAAFRNKHVWLNFEGINYIANVWVNGSSVGRIEGAFARGKFDISSVVKRGDHAVVAVEILPPPTPGDPQEQTVKNGTGQNGGALGKDSPTFLASVGWDWMPGIRDRDMGLWQSVTISASGPVTIEDPYVTTELPLPKTDRADLKVQVTLNNVTGTPESGLLSGEVQGTPIRISLPVSLGAHETKLVTVDDLHLDNPKLWWPNGYGAPNLYQLKLEYQADGTSSDKSTTTFGVRTISYFPNGRKNIELVVNGVPVYCKGGNWGMDEAMKRSPLKRLEAQMRFHRDANCTMIRNWVGQATQEDFYDVCDRYGIMVWDDFWLANPADGPNPSNEAMYLANAREKIVRYRNHPSIAVWCGRNEGDPPKNLEEGVSKLIADLDGKRFYQKHSSRYNGISGGGPYSWRNPAEYFQDAFQDWDTLHTEIGAPSIPTLQAIQAMMPKKDWWPLNDDWAMHDLCRGAQGGDRYIPMLSARYGEVTGLEDFVRKGEAATYEGYRAMYEARNAHLFTPCSGLFIWMSNPAQPSFVWQLYSYDLEPTAAEYGVQKACEPVHVQLDPRTQMVQVVNNLPQADSLRVVATAYDLHGVKVASKEQEVGIAASAAQEAFKFDWVGNAPHFVRLELYRNGQQVAENLYWRGTQEDPNSLSALQGLPKVKLDLKLAKADSSTATETKWEATVTNSTKEVAFMAHLQLRKARSDKRVLPTFYSDNYVTLMPGESRKILISAAKEDVGGENVAVHLDGWNIDAK